MKFKMLTSNTVIYIGLVLFMVSTSMAGTFISKSTTGVWDKANDNFLKGDARGGDLIQLIWVGENGRADAPGEYGGSTADDVVLDSTYAGHGFPFNPNEGKFSKTHTHDLLTTGAIVFLRAWNAHNISGMDDGYGDSPVYQLVSDFDSHDFGTWNVFPRNEVPIELSSFTANCTNGVVQLEWITESETDNLGYHLYRSLSINGEKNQITNELIEGAINSSSQRSYSWEDDEIAENSVYYYWLVDIATDGTSTFHGPVEVQTFSLPSDYALEQNYPNPFNPSTTIAYSLKEQGHVKLNVYNIRGQLIRTLVNKIQFSGEHSVQWDGRNDQGMLVPSGTYLYTIEANDFKETQKMVFMK